MSKQFNILVDEALAIEKELRALSTHKPSIRGWVSACLSRGGLVYGDIEAAKERLGSDFLRTRMVDSGAYCRDVRKYVTGGSLKAPPTADRIGKMYFSQRYGAIAELGGEPRMLFALVAIVAEQVYQERPELFGGIDDIDAANGSRRSKRTARSCTSGSRDLGIRPILFSGLSHPTSPRLSRGGGRPAARLERTPSPNGSSSISWRKRPRPRRGRLRIWAGITDS